VELDQQDLPALTVKMDPVEHLEHQDQLQKQANQELRDHRVTMDHQVPPVILVHEVVLVTLDPLVWPDLLDKSETWDQVVFVGLKDLKEQKVRPVLLDPQD